MIDPQVALAAALFLGGLLIAAAVHKQVAPRRFSAALASYRLVPRRLLRPAVILVPIVELSIGLALVWPATRHLAAVAAILLLLGYGAAIAIIVMQGKGLEDCGCSFASGPATRPWFPIARNVALSVAGVLILLPSAARPLSAPDIIQALLAMASLALLYVAAEALGATRIAEKNR